MPRRNRVTPHGQIIATPQRGTFMAYRGVLHDENGRIQRSWQVKRWLVCVLEFRGRHRTVMTPNRYTELFFLDEATALAAGHRPCAECRHARFLDFSQSWKLAHRASRESQRPTADEIDRQLHADRFNPDRSKRTYVSKLDDLPGGVFVTLESGPEQAFLIWNGRLLHWSPAGYEEPRRRPANRTVRVLTPRSTVAAIRHGYVPEVHDSANL